MRLVLQRLLRVAALDATQQVISSAIFALSIGAAVFQPSIIAFAASVAAAATVSMIASFVGRYYADRHEPYRIRRSVHDLHIRDAGRTVIYRRRMLVRARHSQIDGITLWLSWTGEADLLREIRNLGSSYRMKVRQTQAPDGNHSRRYSAEITFEQPLRRFRSAEVSFEAVMHENERTYTPYLGYDASHAYSLFASEVMSVSLDETASFDPNKTVALEYRALEDTWLRRRHPLDIRSFPEISDQNRAVRVRWNIVSGRYYRVSFGILFPAPGIESTTD